LENKIDSQNEKIDDQKTEIGNLETEIGNLKFADQKNNNASALF